MIKRGFEESISDSSWFILKNQEKMICILIYVDDILLTGPRFEVIQELVSDLNSKFDLKNLGELRYFLGFEAHRNEIGLYLNQA